MPFEPAGVRYHLRVERFVRRCCELKNLICPAPSSSQRSALLPSWPPLAACRRWSTDRCWRRWSPSPRRSSRRQHTPRYGTRRSDPIRAWRLFCAAAKSGPRRHCRKRTRTGPCPEGVISWVGNSLESYLQLLPGLVRRRRL